MTLHKKLKKASPIAESNTKPLFMTGYRIGYESARKAQSALPKSKNMEVLATTPQLPSWRYISKAAKPYLTSQTPENQVFLEKRIREYAYDQARRLPKEIREESVRITSGKREQIVPYERYFAEQQVKAIGKQFGLDVRYNKRIVGVYVPEEQPGTEYVGKRFEFRRYDDKAYDEWSYVQKRHSEVASFYTENSKVMRSSKRLLAVKLKSRDKGWIWEGKFYTENEIRFNLFSLNSVSYAFNEGLDLVAMYDSLNVQQRADFTRGFLQYVNGEWDVFYKEKIGSPPRQGTFDEGQMLGTQGISDVLKLLRAAAEGNIDEVLAEIGIINK